MRLRRLGQGLGLVGALLGPVGSAHALDPANALTQFGRDVWQLEDGLPQNSVYSLAQTTDGYLWFGTAEGLVRFDGVRFAVFDRRNTPAFTNNVVEVLYRSRSGVLWVGTDAGLVRGQDGGFSAVPQVSGRITAIMEDARGALWVGTWETGAFRLEAAGGEAIPVHGLGSPAVRALAEGRDGSVWVAMDGAGVEEVRDGKVVRRLRVRDGLASDRAKALAVGRRGELWIGTHDAGVSILDGSGLRRVASPSRPLADHVVTLFVDHNGSTWMGTAGPGLLRHVGDRWQALGPPESPMDDHVMSFMEDTEGSIWIGTLGGGLHRLRDGRFTPFGVAEGLRRDSIRAIAEDRTGTVWIGSEGGGVSAVRDGAVVRTLTTADGLLGDRVYSVAEDRSGSLWIGSMAGLNRLRDGQVAAFSPSVPDMSGGVHVVLPSRDGALWIGTFQGGLLRLEASAAPGPRVEGRVTAFGTRDGLGSDTILSLAESRDGSLWVGTAGGGLSHLTGGRITTLATREGLPSGYVYALHEDASGALWIGTFGGGLCRLKNGRLSVIGTREGLVDDVVYGLVEDEAGDFWLTSNRGIFRVSRAELDEVADGRSPRVTTWAYDLSDGLRSVECNSGGQPATRTRDGGLWFATVKGAARTYRTRLVPSPFRPPVHVEDVVVDGATLPFGSPPRLPPGGERFEFHYTALGLHAPSHIRFRYRLEGLDRDWVDAGTRRVAYYNRLPHGRYAFRVVSSNEDGQWTGDEAAVRFSIAPHVYETVWFRSLALLLAGLAIVGAHRARVRRIAARAAELEGLVAARTAELKQSEARALAAREEAVHASHAKSAFLARMSHELRTPLNIILGFVQLLDQEPARGAADRERLGLIARSGEHLLRLINDVLSLAKIESGRLTLDETVFDPRVVLRDLEEMFRAAAARKGVALESSIQPGWPEAVKGDEGKLRQVLINLLGNAVKFTAQGRIGLAAEWRGGEALIDVDDTGPGIAPEERSRLFESFSQAQAGRKTGEGTGLGLSISRSFARVMGGEIEVLEAPGGGARFRVRVPLPAVEEKAHAPEPAGHRFVLAPGHGARRLLVVDDTALNRQLLRQILEGMGFEVEEAASGGDAVARWEQWRPDLVWMDIRMGPGMDGHEATREIRRREAALGRPRTCIVALTASALEEDRASSVMAGADDVVAKPFRIATIAAVLARQLDARFVPASEPKAAGAPPPNGPAAAVRPGDGAPVTIASLAHLPPEWTADLDRAIRRGDVQAAQRVVERIRDRDAPAAESLQALIRAYRFDEVLALTASP